MKVRYVNMDYLFFSCLSRVFFIRLIMLYDIVCQWSVHLWERMSAFADSFQIDHVNKAVIFLVLKFHLPAHVAQQ
jgi:hypothetical protein